MTSDEALRAEIDRQLARYDTTDRAADVEQRPETAPAQTAHEAVLSSVDALLSQIDPRDSKAAQKLFFWLVDNGRIHKVGTLDNLGYQLIYQEPEGSTQAGWTHGGTQGDRAVDEALERAKASGNKAVRGLCRKCFSAVTLRMDDNSDLRPRADVAQAGQDPAVCSAGGDHVMAS